MNIETQEKLLKLQEKGYHIFWENNPYVATVRSGYLFRLTDELIMEKCVFETDYNLQYAGQIGYADSVMSIVFLAEHDLSEFRAYQSYSLNDEAITELLND